MGILFETQAFATLKVLDFVNRLAEKTKNGFIFADNMEYFISEVCDCIIVDNRNKPFVSEDGTEFYPIVTKHEYFKQPNSRGFYFDVLETADDVYGGNIDSEGNSKIQFRAVFPSNEDNEPFVLVTCRGIEDKIIIQKGKWKFQ